MYPLLITSDSFMKKLLFAVGFAFSGILTTSAQAQVIPLTIDSTQSSVSITFNQLANSLMLDGDLEIMDRFGFAGGDQTFELSGVPISPVDFNNVDIARLGNVISVSSSVTIEDTVNFGVSDLPLIIEMNLVASGVAPELTLLGDVNLDGAVDCFDISPFIIMLIRRGFSEEADCDSSGLINYRDIPPFIFHLSGR